MYKYDLGHISQVVGCCTFVKLGVQSVRERQREREREKSLPPLCGKEGDKRLLPLCLLYHCISSHIVIVYSLWAVVVFPTWWVFHVIPCVSTLFTVFLHFDLVDTSYIRLWPNELGDLFLSLIK